MTTCVWFYVLSLSVCLLFLNNLFVLGFSVIVCFPYLSYFIIACNFYRAMHFSEKRGIAIACRLSVCLSVHL